MIVWMFFSLSEVEMVAYHNLVTHTFYLSSKRVIRHICNLNPELVGTEYLEVVQDYPCNSSPNIY